MSLIIGTILSVGFDAGITPVSGFLPCNGSAVDRTIYAGLFKAIGTRWGTGDGAYTFNLPDLRKVSRGDDADSIKLYAKVLSLSGELPSAVNIRPHRQMPHLPIDSPWYQTTGSHYTAWSNDVSSNSHIFASDAHEIRHVNVYPDYVIYTGVLT